MKEEAALELGLAAWVGFKNGEQVLEKVRESNV